MLNIKDKYNLTIEENIFLAKKSLEILIYSSAKLEGINITFPETQTILNGVNVPNVRLDDITCILNLRDAWKEVLNNIDEDLNLQYICKINSFISRNESLEWGVLRTGQVGISGTNYIPTIPNENNVKEENLLEFNQLLTNYYNTNKDEEIINFIYQKCIFGIDN